MDKRQKDSKLKIPINNICHIIKKNKMENLNSSDTSSSAYVKRRSEVDKQMKERRLYYLESQKKAQENREKEKRDKKIEGKKEKK